MNKKPMPQLAITIPTEAREDYLALPSELRRSVVDELRLKAISQIRRHKDICENKKKAYHSDAYQSALKNLKKKLEVVSD